MKTQINQITVAAACIAVGMLSVEAHAAFGWSKKDSGQRTVSVDISRQGPVAGVGIESQDVISMTDQMVRDLLSNPDLSGSAVAPQIIVDSQYFTNESSQRLNKDLITNRLRIALNRASQGRLTFVGRQYAAMVAEERELKREGIVDVATTGLTQAQAGADYRLAGTIGSLDSRDPSTGMMQRYTQIIFELVDLERGTVVWSGMYEFGRAAADDIVYR
jgi:hypothetical protein